MKRFTFYVFIICLLIFNCSSDDDSDTKDLELESDFVLEIEGTSISNETIAIDLNNFNLINDSRIEITAGGGNSPHFFGIYLPYPLAEGTFIMVEGSSLVENTAFYVRNESDTYYTINGIIQIIEIIGGSCETYKGTLDIDLALVGNANETVNISGVFEVTNPECE